MDDKNIESNGKSSLIEPIVHKKRKFLIKIVVTIFIIVIVFLIIKGDSFRVGNIYFNTSEISNTEYKEYNWLLAYNTRSTLGVSGKDRLSRILDLNHFTVSSTAKTKDERFEFLVTRQSDCDMFCSGDSYIVDKHKNTISDFLPGHTVDRVMPIGGSIVLIPNDDDIIVYDASKNEIIDVLEKHEGSDNYQLVSENYYIYVEKGLLYSRDIKKHISTEIGRSYLPLKYYTKDKWPNDTLNDNFFLIDSQNEKLFTLIHSNKESPNKIRLYGFESTSSYGEPILKDDPLNLISYDLKTNTTKVITSQTFNFPFYFRKLDDSVLFV